MLFILFNEKKNYLFLSPILLNIFNDYVTNEAPEHFGNFKIGQGIRIEIYADDIVLMAEEETVVQGVFVRRN